jgi:hypothetical protein
MYIVTAIRKCVYQGNKKNHITNDTQISCKAGRRLDKPELAANGIFPIWDIRHSMNGFVAND